MARWMGLGLLAAAVASCGGDDAGVMRVALRMNALPCNDIAGLQAELAVAGRDGVCALDVAADRTISGVCPSIPSGSVVEIRLEYFIQLDPVIRVTLAVANQVLDLTAPSDSVVVVSFADSSVMWSDLGQFDDDTDGISSLEEVCQGRDPRKSGE